MKVLFIANCVPMRGGNMSLLQLMKELSQPPYNVEPVLLTTFDLERYSSSIVKEASALGIRCITARFYPFKWYYSKSPMSFIKYSTNFLNYRRILKTVRKEKFDVIHSNSSIIDVGGYLSAKLKIKHVWHLREFGDLDFNMKPLFGKWQERRLYRNGDRFIAVSESIKKRYLPYISPESKISVVYNGLPIVKQMPETDIRQNSDEVRFCISGAVNEAKRQEDALKAMDMLVNLRNIRNLHLTIIGDGYYRERLERFVEEKNLTEFVTFTGWVRNADEYYASSDVGLMLSANEGFGRVTIEYMRAGLAVIASNSGANPELVEDGKTGLLYPTGDVGKLCDMMERMVTNPDLRQALAAAGHEFSMTHFLSADNTKSVYNLYLS